MKRNHFFFDAAAPGAEDPHARVEQLLHESTAASDSVISGKSPHSIVSDFFLAVARMTEAQAIFVSTRKQPGSDFTDLFRTANERGAKAQERLMSLVSKGMNR